MNVTVLQENLAAGLAAVGRAAPGNSALPILGNVLLDAADGRLRLTATNLEVGIHCWVGARVLDPGQATVPAKLFAELVKALPASAIEIRPGKANRLAIVAGPHKSNLTTIEPIEFPDVPTSLEGTRLQLEGTAFRTLVERSAYAANPGDKSRPALTGVLFECAPEGITLAAADGFRLAVAHQAHAEGQERELPPLLIPAQALGLAASLLPGDEPIMIHVPAGTPSRLLFAGESLTVVAQLIDAKFPDYRQIVPHGWATRAVMPTSDLVRAIKTGQIFAQSSSERPLSFDVTPGTNMTPGSVTVAAVHAQAGDTSTVLDASVEGEPCKLGLNARYVMDALKVVESPHVALEFNDPTSAVVLRPTEGDEHLCVLMPLRLSQ